MTANPYSDRAVLRVVMSMSTVAFLCSGLVACSNGSTKSAPPAGAANATVGASDAAVGGSDAAAANQSGPPAAGGADTSHPCALLTRAEAADAVGQPLTAGSENTPPGNCVYSTPDFAAGVDITVSTWDAVTKSAHAYGHTPPAVSGVGDEAYLGVGLSVRKGNKGFLLMLDGPLINKLPDHGLAKKKALAALILARL